MSATQYARSGDLDIAYQVVGDGPFDLLFVPTWFSNVEVLWDSPMVARFLDRLASFSRLILFDRRGSGLSDRCGVSDLGLEARGADAVAVLDAAGSDRAALFGTFLGGSVAVYLAARFPERITALALHNAWAALDSDGGATRARHNQANVITDVRSEWGRSSFGLSDAISDRHAEWWQRYQRMSMGPGDAARSMAVIARDDVRDLLGLVRVPTLIVQNTGNAISTSAHGRYLAANIDGARYLEFEGDDPGWLMHADDPVLDEVQEFLIGSRAEIEPDRQLATILYTDIIGSTAFTARAGDTAWRDAIETHDRTVATIAERHGGTVVKTTGDGALVTFDRPSSAIRCGRSLATEAARLGFEMRLGMHTGEIEYLAKDVAGLAVVIAQRTMQLAPTNRLVVTNTVRDLLIGSSTTFEDLGTHELKGVPGTWRIWCVTDHHH